MVKNKFTLVEARSRLKQCLHELPRRLGVEAVEFFDNSFKSQGFTDATLIPWRRTKSGKNNLFSRKNEGILIGRGRLRRGTRLRAVIGMRAEVVNNVPYAAAHNEGFKGTVNIPQHLRRIKTFAYDMKSGKRKKTGHQDITVKAHSRRMNLPRRRFMGNSRQLSERHKRTILITIYKALK